MLKIDKNSLDWYIMLLFIYMSIKTKRNCLNTKKYFACWMKAKPHHLFKCSLFGVIYFKKELSLDKAAVV